MFKFFRHYAESMNGAGIYPLISLVIFVSFFAILLWYLLKADKNLFNHMSDLPLDKDVPNS